MSETIHTFELILEKTYWDKGCFNVRVPYDHLIGADREDIAIQLADAHHTIQGVINRRANQNGTARIMGKSALRDWFQTFPKEHRMRVTVNNPNSIKIQEIKIEG
jgi:hypothetical protein